MKMSHHNKVTYRLPVLYSPPSVREQLERLRLMIRHAEHDLDVALAAIRPPAGRAQVPVGAVLREHERETVRARLVPYAGPLAMLAIGLASERLAVLRADERTLRLTLRK